jgi:hypothetical protein
MSTTDDYQSPYLLSDDQILKLGVPDHCIEIYRRKHYQDSYGLNSWYHIPELQTSTFRTVQLELSFEEAEAICKQYRKNLKIKDDKINITEHQIELLNKLKIKLEDTLKDQFPNGAFVKLNTRSPKDAPWRETSNPVYQNTVDIEMKKLNGNLTPNNVYIAFLKAMNKCMKVTNSEQAFQLLTRSERVNADLQKNLQYGSELFTSKIEIREWIDEVAEHPEMEFRSFVHNKQLNAVSQYFSDNYFESLHVHGAQERIQNQLSSFFERVKQYIPHPSFVIDFYVRQDGTVMIIELNRM